MKAIDMHIKTFSEEALSDIEVICEDPKDNWITTINSKVTIEELHNYFLNSPEGFYKGELQIKPIKIVILK